MSNDWHEDHKKAIAEKWTQCPVVENNVYETQEAEVERDELKKQLAERDKLIEQMREALKTVVSSAPPGGPLWYGSAEIVKAVAAIKAAERGE